VAVCVVADNNNECKTPVTATSLSCDSSPLNSYVSAFNRTADFEFVMLYGLEICLMFTDLKCLSVRTCLRRYVCPSAENFFDFNESWHVCRGRRVMHDDMQYDLIQGQGHEPF